MKMKPNKTILHIFNTKSTLDKNDMYNLPIGLFGDFYSHELTFFLIKDNDIKNIKQIFNKNNLNIKKIFLKSFTEGTQLINKDQIETFFIIKIGKNTSKIIFFDNASFRYSEHFNFGTDIIIRDIEKICSLDKEVINNFLTNSILNSQNINDDSLLEKKYFVNDNYRKIRKKLILDIAKARIEEVTSIILNKNINVQSFKQNDIDIKIIIVDKKCV